MNVPGTAGATRTIPASKFRANYLKLIDEIQESGGEIVITKHGRPAAKLMPHAPKLRAPFGRDKHLVRFMGDIITPLDVEWEAENVPRQRHKACGSTGFIGNECGAANRFNGHGLSGSAVDCVVWQTAADA